MFFLDASYFKVRTDGRYINKALLIVTAIYDFGYREILSAAVDDSEDESCWENCFESLKDALENECEMQKLAVILDGM